MGKTRGTFCHKRRGLAVTRLLARDGDRCPICREPLNRRIRDSDSPWYLTFDHIVPRSLGGLTKFDNLRLTHQLCNSRRGNDPVPDTEIPDPTSR